MKSFFPLYFDPVLYYNSYSEFIPCLDKLCPYEHTHAHTGNLIFISLSCLMMHQWDNLVRIIHNNWLTYPSIKQILRHLLLIKIIFYVVID
jgi:hypothetical protein